MDRRQALERICRERGVLALYLFGSRADDGLRLLAGEQVEPAGSDLDTGVVFSEAPTELRVLARLDIELGELFEPLRLDLVPLQRVDAIFQARAIDGHRIFAADPTKADLWELLVMRRAAELLPIQRELEREMLGISTS